jgi:hypothetical protein
MNGWDTFAIFLRLAGMAYVLIEIRSELKTIRIQLAEWQYDWSERVPRRME